MVAKPERKSDVPPIPEVANIVRQERAIEVFRCADSKQAAEPDRKRAVAGKVKKQIKAVAIHVDNDLAERFAGCLIDPEALDQGCENEFVKKPAEYPVGRRIEIDQKIFRERADFQSLSKRRYRSIGPAEIVGKKNR